MVSAMWNMGAVQNRSMFQLSYGNSLEMRPEMSGIKKIRLPMKLSYAS